MPAMTWLGWFHTIMGIAALLLAIAAISRHGVIKASTQTGAWYLIVTVIVAGSALGIYNQGGFGVAHILGLLTLGAALGGFLLERFKTLWSGIALFSGDCLQRHHSFSHDSRDHRLLASIASRGSVYRFV
jgi:hypothetical protein